MRSTPKIFRKDGVNSVKYSVVFKNSTELYTHFMINVGDPPEDEESYIQHIEQQYLSP